MDQNESSNLIDSSSFFQNSHSFLNNSQNKQNQSEIDDYVDDDDPGFDLYECDNDYENRLIYE